jgi:hypothetical protein
MSDVTVAPAATPAAPAPAAAPPAPAAPQTQVPINENPVNSPPPVGPQAPPAEKPEKRPETRREGIQRAIDTVRAKAPAPAREAKKGDNQPPEDTPDEKIDLKKRPSDQPRERGRFAAKAASDAQPGAGTERPAVSPGQPAAPKPYTPPPPGSPPHHHPIPRMSERAKADWDKVPDTVRMDAHRIAREVDQAFRQYKGAHDYMQTIAPYAKMAHEQGTHLSTVLKNHVNIENKLREDPLGGFEVIAHNLNLHTPDGRKITFADICYDYLNRSPEQHQLVQQRNAAQAHQLQIEQLRREQQALANEYRRMQYVHHFQTTRGAVDRYADTRPRFDELGDLIHQEIKLGFDLDTAYRRAEMLRPATAAQTRNGQTAAQTRTPDKSISGAPGGSSNANGVARPGKPVSRKDAIARAIQRHSGAL